MKTKFIAALSVLLSSSAFAQFDPTPFIQGSTADIEYLGGEYLNPAAKALATGINNAWYNSAEVHEPGGFEINLSAGIILIPESDQSFIIEQSKLDQLELVNPQDNLAPTAFGEDSPGPELRSKADATATFEMPGGLGSNVFPQLGITAEVGVGMHTDVMLRYFPTIGIPGVEDGKIGMYGFGFNHSFLEWFDSSDDFPVTASVLFAFTQLSYSQNLNTTFDGSNQELELTTKGYTARLIVSREFSFLTLYGGIGMNSGSTQMLMLGTYKYQENGVEVTSTDPLDITEESSTFAANLGFKLKLLKILSFNADYSFGNYQALTVGLGFDVDFKK